MVRKLENLLNNSEKFFFCSFDVFLLQIDGLIYSRCILGGDMRVNYFSDSRP